MLLTSPKSGLKTHLQPMPITTATGITLSIRAKQVLRPRFSERVWLGLKHASVQGRRRHGSSSGSVALRRLDWREAEPQFKRS
jgi:hypothetical protein